MLIGLVQGALLLSHKPSFALPKGSHITIERRYPAEESTNQNVCSAFRINLAAIRGRFRTYHATSGSEFHDYYLQFGCGVGGKIHVNGKTFFWIAEPGNLLRTDYPDGVVRWLGGKHTDDPADGG